MIQQTAQSRRNRNLIGLRLSALAVSIIGGCAQAAELSREKLGKSTDVQNCAVHGPGYVRVEGTDACARIGSRLRVDMNAIKAPRFIGGFPQSFDPGADFEPGLTGDGPARAYLRLDRPAGPPPERSINR